MKLRLPLPLVSALTSAFIAFSFTQPVSAADSICINFGSVAMPSTDSLAGVDGIGVASKNWNNALGNTGTIENLINSNNMASGVSITWKGGATGIGGTGLPGKEMGEGNRGMMGSYLDDKTDGTSSFSISNIEYLSYDLYIYCSYTAGYQYAPKSVNGVTYMGKDSGTAVGDSRWGQTNLNAETGQFGEGGSGNYLRISLTGSVLEILGDVINDSWTRGGVAGIMIVNTAGTAFYSELTAGYSSEWGAVKWKDISGGDISWVNSSDDFESSARFSVVAGGTASVSITDPVTTNSMSLSSGTLNITGGELKLVKSELIVVDKDATLSIASKLSSDKGLITKRGQGTLVLTGGALAVPDENLKNGYGFNIEEGVVNATGGMTLSNGKTTTVAGEFNMNGTLTMNKSSNHYLVITKTGKVNITGGLVTNYSPTIKNSGEFNVTGTLQLRGGGTTRMEALEGSTTTAGTLELNYNGKLTVAGTVKADFATMSSSGSELIMNDKAVAEFVKFRASGGNSSVKVNKGAYFKLTGDISEGDYNNRSFVLGHGGIINKFTVDGGKVDALNAVFHVGSPSSTDAKTDLQFVVQNDALVNLYGINNAINASVIKLTNSRLNMGAGGISALDTGVDGKISLDNVTLGALDSWTNTGLALEIGSGGIIVNTEQYDAVTDTTNGSAKDIVLNGKLSSVNTVAEGTTVGNLTKRGAGTLTLGADNSAFTGAVYVQGGGIALRHVNALGSSDLTIKAAPPEEGGETRVAVGDFGLDMGGLAIANNVDITGNTEIKGASAFTGNLTLNSGALTGESLHLVAGKSYLFKGGSIANDMIGDGGFTKNTQADLTLGGVSTYSGATNVEAGKLIVSGSVSSSAVTVMSGAALQFTGTGSVTGNITMAAGSSLDTGAGLVLGQTQVVTIAEGVGIKGGFTLDGGGTLKVSGDLVLEGGVLSLNGGNLEWTNARGMTVKGLVLGENSDADVLKLGNGNTYRIGSEGIKGTALTIGEATLEATADWTMEAALNLSNTTGGLTLHTGSAGAAYTIALNSEVSGTSKMTKTGEGTLILSGANANYSGGISVKGGALSLGDDLALGTGALNMGNGTTLSAEGKSVTVNNTVSFGSISDTNYTISFGKTGQEDILTLSGNVQLNGGKTTISSASDVVFSSGVTSVGNTLTKTGAGALTFGGTLSALEKIDVNAGTLRFAAETALSSVQNMNMSAGTSLDLGGLSGIGVQRVNVASTLNMEGSNAYVGSVMMATQASRLTVKGDFSAGQIGFLLGKQNQVTDQLTPVLVTTEGSAAITGVDKNSIILNFDVEYISTFREEGGSFQLFSGGLTYNQGTILNEQRQDVMVDESQLAETGRIFWQKQKKDVSWITQGEADNLTVYTQAGPEIYLASAGGEVTVGSQVNYDLEGYNAYKFSPGLGTLVYKGALTDPEAWLYVMDYANVMEDTSLHSDGAVILSNNGNKYASGTNVIGTTLVVDMSRDENQSLDSAISNRNLAVSVLGSGRIEVVAGLAGGSTLQLQSYGDKILTGVDTFTYGNEIHISGGSALKQSGANAQILTGNITIGTTNNLIINEGSKSLTLKGNITQVLDGSLTLKSESDAGRIILSGASQLTTDILNVEGAGVSSLSDGYTATLKGLVLSGGRLSVERGSQLTMGSGNITGTGVLSMNGGTLVSTSSWQSDSLVNFAGGTVSTVNTGGANVRFNKGVVGSGSFEKIGTGSLYIYDNKDSNAAISMNVKQGRLILKGGQAQSRAVIVNPGEYKLTGDLTLSGDKGASLEGMIDANNHKVTFGDNTKFFMSVSEEDGITGYIRNADTITFNTGTKLYLDVLDDTWVTNTDYTIFSANNGLIGADNLGMVMENEFAFVDVHMDKSKANEINLILSRKGGSSGGAGLNDGTNKGAINAVMTPMVADVLEDNSKLTGSLLRTVQGISKMTTSEYDTYLGDMASSAVSYYTALSAQVHDATQHLNSVRNRVELINPVLYDDWSDGGVYNVWAGGVNHYRDVKSDFQSPGYKMTSWGGELGCAIPLSESFMMGVGFAYTSTEVTVKDNWGTNESDTYNVDVFARYRQDRWTLTGVLTGGFSNVDFHRNQRIKDQITRSNSSSDGNQFMGTFEAMYDVYLNEEKSWILQPLVNLTAGRAKLDGLNETGDLKNAGLDLDSQSYDMFSVGVGAKIAYEYQTEVSDLPGRVELKAMYVNDAGDVDFKVKGRFMGAPGSDFELDGVSNERSAVVVSAGWIAPISTYGQFFADASCEFRKDQNGVSSTVGFSFQF